MRGPQHWTGALLQHIGLLGMAGGIATLAYQASFWWFDGFWPARSFGWLWNRMAGDFPSLNWPGERVALLWLLDRPLSVVLLALGATICGFGRILAGD